MSEEEERENAYLEAHHIRRIETKLDRILQQGEQIMSTLDDLRASESGLDNEIEAVLVDVTDLQAKITQLTQQVNTTPQITAADLQPVIDDLNAKAAKIASALSPPPAPSPVGAPLAAPSDSPVAPAPALPPDAGSPAPPA